MTEFNNLKTQKKIKEYTRNIIYKIGLCDDIKNKYNYEYKYFTNFLFPRHISYPDKFIDMINIGIRKNKKFNNLEVYIIKKNDIIDSVSVIKNCISRKKPNNLSIAMRNSIYPQIKNYKNSLLIHKCINCDSIENIQIDHFNQEFIDLQKTFLELTILKIPDSFDDNEWNSKIFKKDDEYFEKEWYLYHKNKANLQPLCKKCNLTKKKSKNRFSKIKYLC